MIEAARNVTGHQIPTKVEARRRGDPASLIASWEKAKDVLGWDPKITDIEKIISSAWKWHQAYPNGYK